MKTIRSIGIIWEHDDHAEPDYLETTPESHYGVGGANWHEVNPETRREVTAKYGSIWAACEEYARQDAARLAAFHAGDWDYEGCYAVAHVTIEGTMQTIRTPGLWGIESDSDEGYRREVEREEREELLGLLDSLGFDTTGHRAEQKAA